MGRQKATAAAEQRTELLGIRVTAERRREIKVEAARRGLTIAELLEELWRDYLERKNAGGRKA
jgi:hypothetical protein